MKTVYLNKQKIKLYDGIDELPILNFQKYNKYLLIDSGIGSTIDDIDAHIIKVAKFIKAQDSNKALQELQNMRQNLYMINSEISPKYLAFACLVHSINDQPNTDLSDEGLKGLIAQINKAPHSWLVSILEKCKKKLEDELDLYFPSSFTGVKEKSFYDKLREKTLLILDGVITGTNKSQEVERLNTELFNFYAPKTFYGAESVEIKTDKQFESICLLMAQKTGLDAKKMTVLEFYSALDNLKKYNESISKVQKHGRR